MLDDEAQKLFDQLGGIDKRERGHGVYGSNEGFSSDPRAKSRS